jgi:hypothetical protein
LRILARDLGEQAEALGIAGSARSQPKTRVVFCGAIPQDQERLSRAWLAIDQKENSVLSQFEFRGIESSAQFRFRPNVLVRSLSFHRTSMRMTSSKA